MVVAALASPRSSPRAARAISAAVAAPVRRPHGASTVAAAVVLFRSRAISAIPCAARRLLAAALRRVAVSVDRGRSFAQRLRAGSRSRELARRYRGRSCCRAMSAHAAAGPPLTGRVAVDAQGRRIRRSFGLRLQLPLPVQVLTTTDGIGAPPRQRQVSTEVKPLAEGRAAAIDAFTCARAHDVGLVINLEGGRQSFGVDDPMWPRFQSSPAIRN